MNWTLSIALGFACLFAATGNAANVRFTLVYDVDPATYDLYATVLDDDNAGLAAYGVTISSALTIDHNSPRMPAGQSSAGEGPAGFTLLRAPDGTRDVFAAQDTITPTPNLIYGFGQRASSFAAEGILPLSPSIEQPVWGGPVPELSSLPLGTLRIASGTYAAGAPPTLGPGGVFGLPFALVFENTGNNAVRDAQVQLVVVSVPEPASICLLALAAMTIMPRRRRLGCRN
jgi:hypothetical protein